MENPLWLWVILALVLAVIVMPFEYEDAPKPAPIESRTSVGMRTEVHKDTHKLHFSMSPFWSNSSGGFLNLNAF